MQVKRILSALLLVLVAWLHVGLPAAIAGTGVAGRVQITDNTEDTYVEQSAIIDPAASTTDAFTKAGSASKTVYIQRVELFYSDSTYNAPAECHLIKRSTLDSGGTSTDATAVPMDSGFASSSSTAMKCFTANPSSLGTEVGKIKTTWIWNDPGPAGTQFNTTVSIDSALSRVLFDATTDNGPIVLRGTSQNIAVNFGGASPGSTAARLACRIIYREK